MGLLGRLSVLFEHVAHLAPNDHLLSPMHRTYFSCTFGRGTVSLDTSAYTLIVRRRIDLGKIILWYKTFSSSLNYPNDFDFEAVAECFSRRPEH